MRHPDESRAVGPDFLHQWLSGRTDLVKPQLPAFRGQVTIGDIDETLDPVAYASAVERWARTTWDAYELLHPIAERWLQAAESARR